MTSETYERNKVFNSDPSSTKGVLTLRPRLFIFISQRTDHFLSFYFIQLSFSCIKLERRRESSAFLIPSFFAVVYIADCTWMITSYCSHFHSSLLFRIKEQQQKIQIMETPSFPFLSIMNLWIYEDANAFNLACV